MKPAELKSKKITMATLKSFIKKSEKLFVQTHTSFDGMVDGVMPDGRLNFTEVSKDEAIGHKGVWCVGSSRNGFEYKENETHFGIEVSNCCGSATLWTNK
jgi:hypothetical protein